MKQKQPNSPPINQTVIGPVNLALGIPVVGVSGIKSEDIVKLDNDQLVQITQLARDARSSIASAFRWIVGDCVVEAQRRGESVVSEVAEVSGLAPQDVLNCAYVSRNIDPSIRIDPVGSHCTWSHHRPVARLIPAGFGPKDQRKILEEIQDRLLSVSESEVLVQLFLMHAKDEKDTKEEIVDKDEEGSDSDGQDTPEGTHHLAEVTLSQVIVYIAGATAEEAAVIAQKVNERIDELMR